MSEILDAWLGCSFECVCGQRHEVGIRRIVIERDALAQVAGYVKEAGYGEVTLVADGRTYQAAGEKLRELLETAQVKVSISVIRENAMGEVAADEEAIVQVMLDTPLSSKVLVAVGAGTVHDIVRFVAHRTKRPFLSVPTAASVDGFASVGAPLIVRGFKMTIPACAPEAIFADLAVLAKSPQAMIAAGLGDMLGKHTSLADWSLGRVLLGEHYCELSARLTLEAVELCTAHLDEIAQRTDLGLLRLMEGLILSGLSMLLVGHSRPASGAEHHLSHYWEMVLLQQRRRALLHGAKVGVATVLMAQRYEALRGLTADEAAVRLAQGHVPSELTDAQRIRQVYGDMAEQVIAENFPANGTAAPAHALKARIAEKWGDVQAIARAVPAAAQLIAWLEAVQGPVTPEQLGVEPELVEASLQDALFVRNRFTILRLQRLL
ncbi:sn-glycerol-1-phosphate dehydrogenase [Paenibacillus alginolyticus]|uniref:Sn-glycerol-1-phosphate dehydrogenase n=1 Tax=Paenibacillus alginolyticus TaxID=59839 RepID=A0ABT4GBB3_9BACL|nr:sn-glycerol-1-phosphate dehydrogenase [Paenibacillus alginolyticus]MCY9693465.1 sn-glycerol-1-phosphate dehydrogenase [Paenibacillus alginolyticus]MEC0146060.1 sn-glycerol-1-phosphate dehydrogenase [Paenibacillus alginolyticus]